MTELEILQRCAAAAGIPVKVVPSRVGMPNLVTLMGDRYDPMMDDGQAMMLVKKLKIWIRHLGGNSMAQLPLNEVVIRTNLNRAICEAVAAAQKKLEEDNALAKKRKVRRGR